jgi:hypothetical protein
MLTLASRTFAEEKSQAGAVRAYQVDIVMEEFDGGKKVDTHRYRLQLEERQPGELRVGSNVPIVTSGGTTNTTYQRIDVGTSVKCTVQDEGSRVIADLDVELTQAVDLQKQVLVTHKIRMSARTILPLDTTTLIGSADELGNKRRHQLTVTVHRSS